MTSRRMISSDLYEDDFYMGLGLFEQNLWVGLIVRCADDQGRIQDNPILIKSQIYPAADYPASLVDKAIDIYEAAGKVMRYEVGGKKMIQIINWWKHQTPSWAAPSKYPAPEGWTDRVKVHGKGTQVTTLNWDKPGGFELPKQLGKGIPNGLPNALNEVDGDCENKGEVEAEQPLEPFDQLQRKAEQFGIMAAGPADIKHITDLVSAGVTAEDLENGIQWRIDHNDGQPVKYFSQIVGPAKTAMQKRLQGGNGKTKEPVFAEVW